FAMLSLAFAQILYTIIFKWTSLTGGDNGLLNVWPPAFLRSVTAYYYFTLLVIGACFLALHAIVNSPFGYALKAIRENPRRARFIGVNVRRTSSAHSSSPGSSRASPGPSSPSTTEACFLTSHSLPSRSSRWSSCCSAACSRFTVRWPAHSASR